MNVNTNFYQKYKTQGQRFAKVIEKKTGVTQIWSDFQQPRRIALCSKKPTNLKEPKQTNATYNY